MRCVTRVFLSFIYFILLNMLFLVSAPNILAADTIRINGSGTCLEMIKPLMAAYSKNNRNISFQMEKPLGSSGAIKALLAGAIDIAIVSRPFKPEEIAQGGKLRIYGKTPLAIVVEKKVPLKTISTQALEDIYSGQTKRWPDGETIRVILRPKEDADTKILKSLSPGMTEAVIKAQSRRGMMIAVTDPESDEAVSRTIGGIGTSGLPGIIAGKLPLKIITLNGVAPSRENLANGKYPLSKDVSFATTDKLPDAAAKFIDFIYSNKGRSIAEKAGVWITVGHP
jgi:phosphate transport system substrate-binding protein